MKKIAIVGMLACALLTGCGGAWDGVDYARSGNMNSLERSVFEAYWGQKYSDERYTGFLKGVHFSRDSRQDMPEGFFCGHLKALKAADYRAKQSARADSFQTLSEVFKSIYGVTPDESCGVVGEAKVVVKDVPVVKVDTTPDVLGPDLYDKMIEVANSCGRSRQYLIDLTAKKEYLTKHDYDAVMKSYMSCKKFELEKALQEN